MLQRFLGHLFVRAGSRSALPGRWMNVGEMRDDQRLAGCGLVGECDAHQRETRLQEVEAREQQQQQPRELREEGEDVGVRASMML